jgi:hypothetical protein
MYNKEVNISGKFTVPVDKASNFNTRKKILDSESEDSPSERNNVKQQIATRKTLVMPRCHEVQEVERNRRSASSKHDDDMYNFDYVKNEMPAKRILSSNRNGYDSDL